MSHKLPRPPASRLRAKAQAQRALAPAAGPRGQSAEELSLALALHQAQLERQSAELRRVQAALEEARGQYLDLYEAAPLGYFSLDHQGQIAAVNRTAAAWLGEDREQLLQRPFARLVAPEHQDRWQRLFGSALQEPSPQTCELALCRSDGSQFDAQLDCRRPATGPWVLRVCLTDLTENRRAREDLLKLSLAVEQSPVSIVITDVHGRIEYVNPAFSAVSGYAAAEVLGQNPRLLQSGLTPPQTYQQLWAAITSGKIWRGNFVNRRKDGTNYFEAATISALRQADGTVAHYVAVKEDVTELNRATEELRLSENRLRLAKTAAGLGVFDVQLELGRIDWDHRLRELWGVRADEPITFAKFMAGIHPDDRAARQAAINRALEPPNSGDYRAQYRVVSHADGVVRHVAVNGQVFFDKGRATRLIGMVRDISEQKQLEAEVQQARSEMEALINQQVAAQTAAAIAHELNQPLIAISAYSEAASDMLRSGVKDPEKLMRALDGATAQSQRAGRTLHELLEFLHKGKLEREATDLNAAVRDAIVITEQSGYGGFRPVLELESELHPVLANRVQLQKVLINLLYNSVEAMRGAGVPNAAITITVRTAAGGDMALVSVQDSGPGFDASIAHRLFDPFFTTKPQGIGLGLAISRALVEAHGGRLWSEPAAGPGAQFHFTVPFAP